MIGLMQFFQVGDEILEINGGNAEIMSHAEAVNTIRNCAETARLLICNNLCNLSFLVRIVICTNSSLGETTSSRKIDFVFVIENNETVDSNQNINPLTSAY